MKNDKMVVETWIVINMMIHQKRTQMKGARTTQWHYKYKELC